MKILINSMILLCFLGLIFGQIPEQMHFQGQFFDETGTAYNGEYEITFSIYDAPTGGTLLWNESQTDTFYNGHLSVFLGDANPLDFEVFDGSILYLQIAFDGMTIEQRSPLLTVPYSFRAAYADSARAFGYDTLGAYLDTTFASSVTHIDSVHSIDSIEVIDSIALISFIDIVDSIRMIDSVNYISAISHIDSILYSAHIRRIDSISFIDSINSIDSIHYIDSVGYIDSISYSECIHRIDSIAHIDSIDFIDSVSFIDSLHFADFIGHIDSIFHIDSIGWIDSIAFIDSIGWVGRTVWADSAQWAGYVHWDSIDGIPGDIGGDMDWQIDGDDMYALPSGNIGVGTSSPGDKLDVDGSVMIQGSVRIGSDGNAFIELREPDDSGSPYIDFSDDSSSDYDIRLILSGGRLYIIGGDFDFNQNEAKSMVIDNRTSDPPAPVPGQLWFRTDL